MPRCKSSAAFLSRKVACSSVPAKLTRFGRVEVSKIRYLCYLYELDYQPDRGRAVEISSPFRMRCNSLLLAKVTIYFSPYKRESILIAL